MRLLRILILSPLFLLLFQLSDNGSIVLAQVQDSSITLSLYELKAIAKLLPELQMRRKLDVEQANKEDFYKSLIQEYQDDQEQYKQKEKLLKANIEAVKPAFYDNFWFGSAITAVVISSIYFIAK